jgi:hypothetical protein
VWAVCVLQSWSVMRGLTCGCIRESRVYHVLSWGVYLMHFMCPAPLSSGGAYARHMPLVPWGSSWSSWVLVSPWGYVSGLLFRAL